MDKIITENYKTLKTFGGHFVLCERDKTALKGISWKRSPPSFNQIIEHLEGDRLVGIVPASLGCAVLDVDKGGKLSNLYIKNKLNKTPLVVCPTKRRGGYHNLVACSEAGILGNKNLYRGDLHFGELRASKGYAIIYDVAAWVEFCIRSQTDRHNQSTAEQILELCIKPEIIKPKQTTLAVGKLPVEQEYEAVTDLDISYVKRNALAYVTEGSRNTLLCKQVGFVLGKRSNLGASCEQAISTALYLNNFIPNPLPYDEVKNLGASLWRGTQADLESGLHNKRFSERQRQRQAAGVFRRRERCKLDERDIAIHDWQKRGHSVSEIALLFRLSVWSVRRILNKPAPQRKAGTLF